MGPWTDFFMLTLALIAGWLGLVTLVLSGWRPVARPARTTRTTSAPVVVNSQAVDSDR
jgi:hypothetical protein